ncbi:uncharacterized protein LOC121936375 [Sceloporus undulatus]|uniref:uncharacterized protein LOC121936375 n=1 Tax=Sceloporus undulatus TaxID=8520 RepID=UPI001C4D39A3|nr:uncharacterized protein LOC121936375 [Sceloporus undulatus]
MFSVGSEAADTNKEGFLSASLSSKSQPHFSSLFCFLRSPMSHSRSLCCWCPPVSQPSWIRFLLRKKVTIKDLPEDVLLEVLSLVPRKDLILNCRLVCSHWRDLVDLPFLWKRKCQRMGFYPETSDNTFQDWRTFCFLNCKRNLVKNPCGEAGLESWQMNGNKWDTDEQIVPYVSSRFYKLCRFIPCPPQDVQKCFIFTCPAGCYSESGTKKQRINLMEEGYSNQLMDETKPKIIVKDWQYPDWRSHCKLHVKLLSATFDILQERYLEGREHNWWNEVSHTFEYYPPGVRHIELEHEIYTRTYVKITDSSVTIDPEERRRSQEDLFVSSDAVCHCLPLRLRECDLPKVTQWVCMAEPGFELWSISFWAWKVHLAANTLLETRVRIPAQPWKPTVHTRKLCDGLDARSETTTNAITFLLVFLSAQTSTAARGLFRSEMAHIAVLPEDILIEVLVRVPARELVRNCRLVCSLWRDLVDLPSLWKRKCQADGYHPKMLEKNPPDWKVHYFLCSLKRNLIKNPCAEEGFCSWEKELSGGDEWKIEDLPGSHGREFPHPHVRKYFVTSYGSCIKSQLITLKSEGYWDQLMDEVKPDIVVKDWYAARFDCGCRYQLSVRLLSADYIVLQEFLPEDVIIEQWSDAEWQEVSYTFHDYPAGVRHILFRHGGQDTQFWAGWYGVRVTNTSVTLGPEVAG